jgi:hypothetical protein
LRNASFAPSLAHIRVIRRNCVVTKKNSFRNISLSFKTIPPDVDYLGC